MGVQAATTKPALRSTARTAVIRQALTETDEEQTDLRRYGNDQPEAL